MYLQDTGLMRKQLRPEHIKGACSAIEAVAPASP
jgi:hypothetical protein